MVELLSWTKAVNYKNLCKKLEHLEKDLLFSHCPHTVLYKESNM